MEKPDDPQLTRNIPRVVIGPGSVVQGTLMFDREVKLYVNDTAKIGPVEGATAQMYSGDDTNNPSASAATPAADETAPATDTTGGKSPAKPAATAP
ncbi:MAG: hypothetical protein WDO56_36525 [Gammaproteobacteria bacterium]